MTAVCPFDPLMEGRGRNLSMPELTRWLPSAIEWRWPRYEVSYGAFNSDWAGGVRPPGRRLGYLVANILDSTLQWLSRGVWRADLDDHDDPAHLFLFDATRVRTIPLRVIGKGRLRIAELDGETYQLRHGGDALVKALAVHCSRFFCGLAEAIEGDDPDHDPVPTRRGGARPLGHAGAAARV